MKIEVGVPGGWNPQGTGQHRDESCREVYVGDPRGTKCTQTGQDYPKFSRVTSISRTEVTGKEQDEGNVEFLPATAEKPH